MIIDDWVSSGAMPGVAEITARERLFKPAATACGFLPLRIVPLDKMVADPQELDSLMEQYAGAAWRCAACTAHVSPWATSTAVMTQ